MYPATGQPAAANCSVSVQISTTMQLYSGLIFYNVNVFCSVSRKSTATPRSVGSEVFSGENRVPLRNPLALLDNQET